MLLAVKHTGEMSFMITKAREPCSFSARVAFRLFHAMLCERRKAAETQSFLDLLSFGHREHGTVVFLVELLCNPVLTGFKEVAEHH